MRHEKKNTESNAPNPKLTLGFSPCPNDTFIFDAMIHGKVDTEGLAFDVVMTDVEQLNKKAFAGELDISKLSFHAYAYVADKYVLMNSGAALGRGCGPILISKFEIRNSKLKDIIIAVPGKYTTANLLLGLYAPEAKNKTEMIFSAIEDAVLDGKADAGVIIHENRFTYEKKGLKKIVDLGEYWEQLTSLSIPLGGIAAKRSLSDEVLHKINRTIRRSIEYAFANPKSGIGFIRKHSQEMSEEVMYSHINLYVNKYSVDLGEDGRGSIDELFNTAVSKKLIPPFKQKLFFSLSS